MKKILLQVFLFSIILTPFLLVSQEAGNTEKTVDPREQIIRYGLEEDVIPLLGELAKEKNAGYNDFLSRIITDLRAPQILKGIFRLWEDTEYEGGLQFAREEIGKIHQDLDYSEPVGLSALAYLAKMKDTESLETLLELVEDRNTVISASAVRVIGHIGLENRTESAQILLEQLKKIDRMAEDGLAEALISTLGDLEYKPAADELVLLIEDTGSTMGQRHLACIAVGKIGREDDYPIIERVFIESENDAMLRSYALAGLAEFEGHDITLLLAHALKRDPFWRIRTTAAEKLKGSDATEILELLKFKAIKDPIKQVRIASLKALASSTDESAHAFLLNYFSEENRGIESRLACFKALLENKIQGTIEAIEKVMDDLWIKDQERFLEFVCRELSYTHWPSLTPVYVRMLKHNNWVIVVYGIRGIRQNELDLDDRIEALDIEGTDGRIRREINLVH